MTDTEALQSLISERKWKNATEAELPRSICPDTRKQKSACGCYYCTLSREYK
jgi:hypothetical protein